jgi:hypothetical protein
MQDIIYPSVFLNILKDPQKIFPFGDIRLQPMGLSIFWNAGLFLASSGNTKDAKFSGYGDNKMSPDETRGPGHQNSRQSVVHFIPYLSLSTPQTH